MTIAETFTLAYQNHQKNNFKDAENLYREALKIDPTNSIAAFNLGVVLEDQSSTHEAIEIYQKRRRRFGTLPLQ